jgi:3-deoxy-D-manno-octulosonic-acid transferase
MQILRLLYGSAATLLTPGIRWWLERRARRGKEDPFRLRERFGYASLPRPEGRLVWLHAASVGEAQSVLTLVRGLCARHPDLSLLITTGTVTSAALVAQQQMPRMIHQFVPVDTPAAVRRFLQHWQPTLALWVESEFWPQLLWQAQESRIPMLLVNARISGKTFRRWQRWPRTIASLLNGYQAIYAGSAVDGERLRRLGAQKIYDVGNLKFDAAPLPVNAKLCDDFRRLTAGRRIWVVASTHHPEEDWIATAHRALVEHCPDLLTVLVPRHATRGDALVAALRARGFRVTQRSKSENIAADTELYLADTMGELGSFYSLADLVFMGGSLMPHGGQNPLEPARFGNAILTGPYTENFASVVAQFVQADAMIAVPDHEALVREAAALLHDPARAAAMAERARRCVAKASGASQAILAHCDQLLQASAS